MIRIPPAGATQHLPAVHPPFKYHHSGSFAYVGGDRAVLEVANDPGGLPGASHRRGQSWVREQTDLLVLLPPCWLPKRVSRCLQKSCAIFGGLWAASVKSGFAPSPGAACRHRQRGPERSCAFAPPDKNLGVFTGFLAGIAWKGTETFKQARSAACLHPCQRTPFLHDRRLHVQNCIPTSLVVATYLRQRQSYQALALNAC